MQASNDVLFVFPPAHGNLGAFKNHLGVSYLRASLNSAGITSSQYLNDQPGSLASVTFDILSGKPKVVGFTVYDANFPLCLALARSIKRHSPEVRVVFGGPTATFGAGNILDKHEAIDFCILGEAEETGPQVFQVLLNGSDKDCEALPGIAFCRDGKVICSDLPPLAGCEAKKGEELDSVLSPYLTGVLTDGKVGVLSGRGCTHHCQYCCFAALGRKRLRLHSLDRVLAELEWIAAHQKRTGGHYIVPIHDDAFTLIPDRAQRLCQMIIERDLGLTLSCITHADKIDEELLRTMKEAGFISLAFGLESAVPAVLRATGKVRSPNWPDQDLGPERRFVEKVQQSVKEAKKLGFDVGVSIILGLPEEREEDGQATLRLVGELPIDYYMHNFLWVFPGTPLWETHSRYGIDTAINSFGLPVTMKYAYDVTKIRPRAKCSLEHDAHLVRLLTAASLFGCGSFSGANGDVGVAVVHADELAPQTAAWLAEILDVGGLIIQTYAPLKRSEEAVRLYYDRLTYSDCLVPARHHIQVLKRQGKKCDERWMLNCSGSDLYCSHKPHLVSLQASIGPKPLIDWAKGQPVHEDFCEVAAYLQAPRELNHFLDRMGGEQLSRYLRKMPVPPAMKYPGRWLQGRPACLSLTRIEIDQDQNVRCCRHGAPLGQVGDSPERLRANLTALMRAAEKERGCETCPNLHCPRCPFPGMEPGEYCDLMGREKRVLDLLNLVYLYSRLPMHLEAQRDRVGND